MPPELIHQIQSEKTYTSVMVEGMLLMVYILTWPTTNLPSKDLKRKTSAVRNKKPETDEYDATNYTRAERHRVEREVDLLLWEAQILALEIGGDLTKVESITAGPVSDGTRFKPLCGRSFIYGYGLSSWGSDQCTVILQREEGVFVARMRPEHQWQYATYNYNFAVQIVIVGGSPSKVFFPLMRAEPGKEIITTLKPTLKPKTTAHTTQAVLTTTQPVVTTKRTIVHLDEWLRARPYHDYHGSRGFGRVGNKMWEQTVHNDWYKWVWYTAKEMVDTECLVCTDAPTNLPTVVPERHTFKECAKMQQTECREGRFTPGQSVEVLSLPLCAIQCRLIHGSRDRHDLLEQQSVRASTVCAEYTTLTAQNEPPTDYMIEDTMEYECFTSGAFSDSRYNWQGTYVGNTTVKCNVTWVLSWFPHANMTSLFVENPVWYENPEPLNQNCLNITMTLPNAQLLSEQTTAVADSYWMCGNDILLNTLPPRWIGLCTLVRMKVPVHFVYEGVNNILKIEKNELIRSKRAYEADPRVYLNAIGQPRGIPDEFKARHEVVAGIESMFIWVTANKNVEWINFIYYNQQRFINYTNAALGALGEQLDATSKVAWQNRQVLDWMLAGKGGVCVLFGEQCCTYIPNNTAPGGSFDLAMRKLRALSREMSENAGKNDNFINTEWLELKIGKIGATLTKMGITVAIALGIISVLICCIIPILRKVFARQVTMMLATREAETQLAQMVIDHPDLFPIPDYDAMDTDKL